MSSDTVILISGCSTGFGREIAFAALNASFKVIATARKLETLDDLKAKGVETLALDVTVSTDDLTRFAERAIEIYGHVDVLVNNAGYLLGGAIEENSHEANFKQFNTNFFGLINLTNAFLPHMRARKVGTIINVSSQGGSLNIAGAGMYCASKAAVDSISATWAKELADYNIRCTALQLGSFRTSVATSNSCIAPTHTIDGYTKAQDWLKGFQKAAGTENGDPRLAAEKVVQLIIQKGPIPAWLPIGDDAIVNIGGVHGQRKSDVEDWKELGGGTNFA